VAYNCNKLIENRAIGLAFGPSMNSSSYLSITVLWPARMWSTITRSSKFA